MSALVRLLLRSRLSLLSVSVAALVLCAAAPAPAQTASGQITGSVKDASGSVIAKVKVTVANQDTGLTRDTTSNDQGDYVVPLLPVGRYVVTAEQAGFKIAVRSDVQLTVDRSSGSIWSSRPATCPRRWR